MANYGARVTVCSIDRHERIARDPMLIRTSTSPLAEGKRHCDACGAVLLVTEGKATAEWAGCDKEQDTNRCNEATG